ncbi:MAG: 4-hydroxyphenylacetate 3-hydroxylase family protein [Chloroflexota bacterium]
MKTAEEYIDSLRHLNLEVYLLGEQVHDPVNHPIIKPSVNSVAMTYRLAREPVFQELMTTTSPMTEGRINRFTSIHQSNTDLANKVKMQRLVGQRTGSCFQRCVGYDAINAMWSVTHEIDQQYRTDYHPRLREFVRHVQAEDLTVGGAMTDVKGDRGLRPSQQTDPDMFLRVVERHKDGIVVNGAKAHQTGTINSHEVLVMPTLSLKEDDRDYAVSFAVPTDTKGLLYIYGRQPSDTRKLEGGKIDVGNSSFGGQEVLIIFDHVFVPMERVFLCGEFEFSGRLVERFAGYHRQSYGGCKSGVGDVLIGAAAKIAEYNGVSAAAHIRDKLVEMIHLNETLYSCGLACSWEGHCTSASNYQIDMLLANVCKQNVTRFPYEIARLAEDIAGGLMVTLPSERDLRHPKVGAFMEKYLKGVSEVPTEHRVRLLRLIENMTVGLGAVSYRTESMHGAGSPQAQRIMITRHANLEEKKRFACTLAGIPE